jgi:NAD(P)-dependent dehydrogenase (short-subunit alcohol dehydrogenase family)
MSDKTIFITGASRGIGRATALLLDQRGYHVFAGVRKQSDGEALCAAASHRLHAVTLDLLDVSTIHQAAETIQARTHGLTALINNAGLAVPSPVEFIPLDALRHQFEVNVFGTIALTQAMLPLIRRQSGRIINVSSIAGRVTAPLLGAYSASKFALEATNDALRLELKPWNIRVVSIQPGVIDTDFGADALRRAEEMLPRISNNIHRLYGDAIARERARANLPARGISSEQVAGVIVQALETARPRTRYVVGPDARLIARLRSLLPDSLMDRLILSQR